jgi:hypothetical protein
MRGENKTTEYKRNQMMEGGNYLAHYRYCYKINL